MNSILNPKNHTIAGGLIAENYLTQELEDKISSVLVFPVYAIKKFLTPPSLMALVVLVGTIAMFWLHHYLTAPIFLVAGVLAVCTLGVVWGIYYLSDSLTNDVRDIMKISLDVTDQVVRDMRVAATLGGEKMQNKASFAEIFGAVNSYIIFPLVGAIVKRKVPLIGGWIAKILIKILSGCQRSILKLLEKKKDASDLPEENTEKSDLEKQCDRLKATTERARKIVDSVAETAKKIAIKPQAALLRGLQTVYLFIFAFIFWLAFGG